jgi:hypothetical protein
MSFGSSQTQFILTLALIGLAFVVAIVLLYHYGSRVLTMLQPSSLQSQASHTTRFSRISLPTRATRSLPTRTSKSKTSASQSKSMSVTQESKYDTPQCTESKYAMQPHSHSNSQKSHTHSHPKCFLDKPCSLEPLLTMSGDRQRIAILVGINYVNDSRNRLLTCFRDIEGIAQWLLSTRAWHASNLYVLTDVTSPSSVLDSSITRRRPTIGELTRVWHEVQERAKRQPTEIVWMYSGHGTHKPNTDDSELDGQDEYLVMTDGLIRDDDVYSKFIRPLPSTCSVLAVMDACHSQTIVDLPFSYNRLSDSMTQESKYLDTNPRMICISGCRDEQTSMAGGSARDYSALTKQILQCLNTRANINQTCSTWYEQLRTRFRRDEQIPMMTCSHTNIMNCILIGS